MATLADISAVVDITVAISTPFVNPRNLSKQDVAH
jgi:hypothetical protein